MIKDIGELLLDQIKTILYGLLFVIAGIYLIPHSWTINIIRFIKPSLLKGFFLKSDKYFNSILSILLEGTFTDNLAEDHLAKLKVEKLKVLKQDLDKIESNMFTIDLLTDLFNTLNFAAVNYSMNDSEEVIENISNYFTNYSNRLFETSYRKNFAEDTLKRFDEMLNYMRESKEYESEDKLGDRMTKASRRTAASHFDNYLRNEKEQLSKTRELIIDSIKKNAIDIMNEAK